MIKDFLGNELNEGDVILRSIHSSFAFHKIIRFTQKSVVISCQRIHKTVPYGAKKTYSYSYIKNSVEKNDINNHNGILYINKSYIKHNFIKAENIISK